MSTPQRLYDKAACSPLLPGHHHPDLWFPDIDTYAPATRPEWDAPRAICKGCPVTAECLTDALTQGLDLLTYGGMRAGLAPVQLVALRRKAVRNGGRS